MYQINSVYKKEIHYYLRKDTIYYFLRKNAGKISSKQYNTISSLLM